MSAYVQRLREWTVVRIAEIDAALLRNAAEKERLIALRDKLVRDLTQAGHEC
ncbi:hypothetical protein [Paenibacillus sp. SI8]|uniref:hypothetical protein n=1 Tax=unclassified Paenibacillus TaxID=185978 RepID=UPI00346515FD